MKQIQSGNLVIRSVDDKLLFEIDGTGAARAEVPLEDLTLVTEFIKTHGQLQQRRRRGYRLDLSELGSEALRELQVWVDTGTGAIPVTPADISITGIRVQSERLTGEAGTQAGITLAFETTRVSLPAVMVRRYTDSPRFAFHFPEVFGEDGRLNPPPEFTRILYALESLWLDRNLDLKWNLA